jgi:hypothetical protein
MLICAAQLSETERQRGREAERRGQLLGERLPLLRVSLPILT